MLVERIKKLCSDNSTSIKELERNLGFGNGTIRRWNDSSPALDKVKRVADFFGVSVAFLTGEVLFDMQTFAETKNTPALAENGREKEILENCKDLSSDEIAKVFAYIEGLKANRK